MMQIDHWLYKIIPRNYLLVGYNPFKWFLWALFGNDEDGIFGDTTLTWLQDRGGKPTFKIFLAWWCRNPMANLMRYVLRSRIAPNCYFVMRWSSIGFAFHIKTTTAIWIYGDGEQLSVAVFPPHIQFRTSKFEGYAGYPFENGKLGFAFRIRNSKGS